MSEKYYDEVHKEVQESIRTLEKEIYENTVKIVNNSDTYLQNTILNNFGTAGLKSCNIDSFRFMLAEIARRVAEETKGILYREQAKEAAKNEGVVLKAVFAGMDLQAKKDKQ